MLDRQVVSNTGIDRRTFSRIPTVLEMPNLVQVQIESFDWFSRKDCKELLEEISPITDHHKKMELSISDPRFDEPWKRHANGRTAGSGEADPRVAEIYCRERDMTYAAPLRVSARLVMRETGEIKETGPDGIFLGDFPMMTTDGTFIINGAERVVVSQLVRSPGVYFERSPDPTTGKTALDRQADPEPRRLARVRDLQPRRHLGQGRPQAQDAGHDPAARHRHETDDELRDAFADVDTNEDRHYIQTTMDKEPTKSKDEALIELYRRLRPGDPPTRDNATTMLENLFFNDRRYDLARVGRYKLNQRLHADEQGTEIEITTAGF